jgi:hypothetical protein
MKKLYYNVYSNINDRQYFKIERKLNVLQYEMSKVLFPLGWRLPDPITKKDGLYVSFIKSEKIIKGNIGVTFDDHPNKITFTFAVIKYFDENNYRFGLRDNLFESEEFSFFEDKVVELTELAVKKYNSWDRDTIISMGEKDELV